MKVYSDLEYANLQNSAADLTGVAGLIYYNTGTTFPKYYSAAWHTFADTDSSQALTNKDYDGGTASNTSRLTLPGAAKATLDALTRKEGTLVYATDENKVYADDGATLQEVGANAAGLLTTNLATSDLTVAAGNTVTHPFLEINTGVTYDGAGNLHSAGGISGLGDLEITGTVVS